MKSLKEQLAEYRTGWYQRVPAERRAIMERHIELCGRRLNARKLRAKSCAKRNKSQQAASLGGACLVTEI
jgi:hypothetical protein